MGRPDPGEVQLLLRRQPGPRDPPTWRLVYNAPQPYTRERFKDTYDWMVSWDMVPAGATYENTVDNRPGRASGDGSAKAKDALGSEEMARKFVTEKDTSYLR